MRPILVAAVALVAVPAFTGCGTLLNLDREDKQIYGGTRLDAALCRAGLSAGVGLSRPDEKFNRPACVGLGLCGFVDLPFSVVADTFTLPITVMASLAKLGGGPARQEPSTERQPDPAPALGLGNQKGEGVGVGFGS